MSVRLETPRLLLRPFEYSDRDDVVQYASDSGWARYLLGHIPHPYSVEHAEAFIAASLVTDWEVNPVWAIEYERRVIGSISATVERAASRASIGYGVGRQWWGRGLTTEAARAVIDWLFSTPGLRRIYATADARNSASTRVMEKIGMRKEGTHRLHRVARDGLADEDWYGILREEWRAGEA